MDNLVGFLVFLVFIAIGCWLSYLAESKPMSLSEMCKAADEQFGPYPFDPHGQVEWAMRAINDMPGTPTSVREIVRRRIWCALANFHRRPAPPEYVPMLASLQRAKEMYERERDAYPADDHDASFPDEDARLIGEAMEIVRQVADNPANVLRAMARASGRELIEHTFDDAAAILQQPVDEEGERWRALLAGRVRVIGSAGLYDNTRCAPGYAHIGLELWTQHTAGEHEPSNAVELLTKYADIGRQGAKS